MISTNAKSYIKQLLIGIFYGLWYSRHHLIHSYVIIPIGIVTLFVVLYGFNLLLTNVFKIQFPASVLGMLINLIALCILDAFASLRETNFAQKRIWAIRLGDVSSWILEKYLTAIQPSMNFSLKWINVFFIPSFVILPLSDHITFIECLKIAAVFLIGGISLMLFDVYSIFLLKKLIQALNLGSFDTDKSLATSPSQALQPTRGEDEDLEMDVFTVSRSYISARNDITTIDVTSLRSTRHVPDNKQKDLVISDNPFMNTIAEPGFLVESLATKSFTRNEPSSHETISQEPVLTSLSASPDTDELKLPFDYLSSFSKEVTIFVTNHIDWFLFFVLFIIALPFYYIRRLHIMLFYHLSITVLAYFIALLVPVKIPQLKKFAHPILVSTAEILFICFIGSLIYHRGQPKGFLEDLKYYKTGKKYLHLFNKKGMYNNGDTIPESKDGFTVVPLWPGCGDILSSLMDISIVSLSLPMFTHRRDFIRNFWVMMPPILASMALTFFCYPLVCYHIGISPERSIGFIGRLVTLALGTPLISTLGGSVSLMAVCTILSGILGVLVGDAFFKLLKVPQEDYVTRGVTLGINCGAIATAHLLNVDPRAASMSSLSFSIFGTVMIILASINAVRELIRSWVGL